MAHFNTPHADIGGASSKLAPEPMPKLGKFISFPNSLDEFDQVTYHFKLYMIDEASVVAQQYLKPAERIIIAESGVTADVAIESVELTSYAGQHFENKNKLTTTFEIKLAESFSTSLIDNIYRASVDLQILNYTDAMYFLELSFRGRTVSKSVPMTPNEFGDIMTWPIKITSIDSEITTAGTMHHMKAFLYTNLGFSNEHVGVIPKPIIIKPGTTVAKGLKRLEAGFNEALQNRAVDTYTVADEVFFAVDPVLGDLRTANEDPSNPNKSGITANPTEGKGIHIPKNYSLTSAINAIFASSGEYVSGMRDTEVQNLVDNVEAKSPKLKVGHRISTFIQHIGFDPVRNRPLRRFIFVITPFKTAHLISNMSETGRNKNSQVTFDNLRRVNAISKHYNYIFTGLNDQIIDFELKFNFGWYVKRPPNAGFGLVREDATEGTQFDSFRGFLGIRNNFREGIAFHKLAFEKFGNLTRKKQDPEIREQLITRAVGQLSQLVDDELKKVDLISDKTKREVARTTVLRFAVARISGLVRGPDSDGNYLLNFGDGIVSPIDRNTAFELRNPERLASKANRDGRLGDYNSQFKEIALLPDTSKLKKTTSAAESFVTDYTAPLQLTTTTPVKYSLSDLEDLRADHRGSPLVEQARAAGIPYIDSLLGQAFSTDGGDMVSLEVKIKGDPFWLETPPLFNGKSLPAPIAGDTEDLEKHLIEIFINLRKTEKENVIKGKETRMSSIYKQNYIIFTVNTPTAANIKTGITAQNTEAYNGLYSVNIIKSTFEGGKFTQLLTCYRELTINTKDLVKNG